MRWWLRAAVLSLLAGAGGEEPPRGAGGGGGAGPAGAGSRGGRRRRGTAGDTGGGGKVPVCRGGIGLAGPREFRGQGKGPSVSRCVPLHLGSPRRVPSHPCPGAGPAGSGRSEPRAVVGRVGDSAVLGCGLLGAHEARPPLYVIEWVRFGFVLPIFIKFGLYSPRVDPEYAGESRGRGGQGVPGTPVGCPVSVVGSYRVLLLLDHLNPTPGEVGGSSRGLGGREGTVRGQGGVGVPIPVPRGGRRDGVPQLAEGMQIPVQAGSRRDPHMAKCRRSPLSPPPWPLAAGASPAGWKGPALPWPCHRGPVSPGCPVPGAAGAASARAGRLKVEAGEGISGELLIGAKLGRGRAGRGRGIFAALPGI